MEEPRLKTELWVKAQLRLCDCLMLPVAVVRRGDKDAGQVLIKRNRLDGGGDLLARSFDASGARVWMVVVQGPEAECDAYIAREVEIDSDLWVLEVEDPNGGYLPDGQEPVWQ